ncbi:glycine betaine/proline transport system ATP-binding protein [Pullulanibacillus pueri]|uniref:Quaternary amine transport ATP-binding protein n=1 Tax=Pullulanibacillus pueri TaxID=1437324 RepID=A0A8J2ZZC5_9BACL|nr:glycine betaine/L-proline ABC transporter ATP-binding protein [Pullulanibacillus pueri]MBM7683749.1 glycine betaine/proline transport system ATP-binding protein [Pullulanibacillus pueri]GGH87356.1 glycine betaine transport ATP-binding protein OpuAA [Pullulanibacillus pueri]
MDKIEVRSVTKVFGKNPKRGVELLNQGLTKSDILHKTGMTVGVNQASFSIKDGEIFVIMGLSGSGKSTLVRLLNRLIEPTSGTVLIDGKDVTKMNKQELRNTRRNKMSMVFQRFALFPHRTILANTEYGLEVQKIPKEERHQKAMEALELVGLKGYEDKKPGELSGGMQQRVGLARALANDADVLLMDEAFSALDPLIRKDMQDELLDLQSKMQKTIVFITHDLDEALRIGDRIVLMKDGGVVQIGTPEEILMNPANRYVEQFVEDVDVTKVFTAEHVMKRPETIEVSRGLRVAMKIMKDEGVSTVYAIDKNKKFLGILYGDEAARAAEQGLKIQDVLKQVETVRLDTLLMDMFEVISGSSVPIPVVDEEGRLRGIVKRSAIIDVMADSSEVLNGDGVTK